MLHRVHPGSTESETQLLTQVRPSAASTGPPRPSTTLIRSKSRRSSVAAIKQSTRTKKGWEAFKELFRFYLVMLQPCLVVTVWMFGFFAALSYLVPNVLCKKSIAATPVSLPAGHMLHRSGKLTWPEE